MIYLDASYVIKCYIKEPGTREVLALVQSDSGRSSAIHGRTELWSGVHRHFRDGRISRSDADGIWREFEREERAGLWHWLPMTENVVQRACDRFEKLEPTLFLRSSDALHLACAAENGFREIYSGDQRQLAAAPHFGLKGISVY